ncbi:hypothetical protein ABE41_018270 [Fictibacillus arsenicus]|uniref:Uncharacterized protein n=1 Tax=Fictibacillus arsenicus TaxID=255247 RepID=A0A1B1Z945_9BACL|nr:oligosaccharide flippase family protein [Fictibacillus arsenicus]ANX13962.1 hypothetical protein ABE41_018270 [Fictibacillus arsenicus]
MSPDSRKVGGQFAKGSIIGILMVVIGYGTQYIFNILTIRLLNPYDAGVFFTYFSILSFLAIFSRYGLDRLGLRKIAIFQRKNNIHLIRTLFKKYSLFIVSLSLFLSILMLFFKELIFLRVDHNSNFAYVFLILSLPGFSLVFAIGQYLRAIKKVGKSSLVHLVLFYGIIITLLLFLLPFKSININLLSICFFISSIITPIIGITIFNRNLKISQFNDNAENFSLKKSLKEAPGILGVNFLTYVITGIDILIIGFLASKPEVAYYSAAARTVLVGSIALVGVNSIMAPLVASAYDSGDKKQLIEIIGMSARWCLTLASISSVILFFTSDFIFQLFGFESNSAILYMYILLISQIVNSSTGSVSLVLQMTNNEKGIAYILTIIVLLMLPSYLLLVSFYGGIGAALVTAIGQICWNIGMVIYARKKLGFKTYANNKFKVSIYVAINLILSIVFHKYHISLITFIVLFIFTTPIIGWKFLLLEDDRLLIKNLLKKKRGLHEKI